MKLLYKMRGLLASIAHAMQPPYKHQIYNLALIRTK
ncbi:hypothetical protein NEOC65_000199 [Neochlamydia sp. AcF65]|nr:hypothetical protein [Neochlamydia sp. AcF65]MBS4170517.1 hypothetical protein [Neochlamydia sp. AcF95]